VLALQDRLGFGPTFDAAIVSLFGEDVAAALGMAPAGEATATEAAAGTETPPPPSSGAGEETRALIDQAAQALADYQRLTAEGKLGEAGQRLDALKRTLEQLRRRK
jgi:uncharacterized membrane protein (UPF0182 family)